MYCYANPMCHSHVLQLQEDLFGPDQPNMKAVATDAHLYVQLPKLESGHMSLSNLQTLQEPSARTGTSEA